jgi:hypothetical protein
MIMVYDVPSSPPAQTRGSPRCLTLPRTSQTRIVSLVSLDLGGKGRTAGTQTHLVAIDATGAVSSFDMGDWSTQAPESMDIDGERVMGKQHPEPIWNSAIRDMANGRSTDQTDKPWAEKAKTKHKVLDLRDIWLGELENVAHTDSYADINEDETDHDTSFSFQTIEQHLRERDAPLDDFVTMSVPSSCPNLAG